ncbi:hypothetical protein JCM18918_546 [Cutibacterium acnes JCM 18918]|nr:hypothetical protein JCM18918_546 [Cutibacterium acnes JCM 18918]
MADLAVSIEIRCAVGSSGWLVSGFDGLETRSVATCANTILLPMAFAYSTPVSNTGFGMPGMIATITGRHFIVPRGER